MHASGGTTQGAKVVGASEWVQGGCTRAYRNRFVKLSEGCMLTKLKVLEFFFGP